MLAFTSFDCAVCYLSDMRVNKRAKVIDADLPATNGMIHAIDDLLMPMDIIEELKQAYFAHHNITIPAASL